jgi:hypothetical protein
MVIGMPDVPVGVIPAPADPAPPDVHPVVAARQARAEKLAKVSAGLAKGAGTAAPAPAPKTPEKLPSERGHEPKLEEKPKLNAAPEEQPPEDEPKSEDKKLETDDAKSEVVEPDDKTKKALDAIDKQAKKFREEQAASKREMEQWVADQRADIARRDASLKERESKLGEIEKLKAEARKNPIDHLRKFAGFESEDEWELVGRGAFPFTKAGKADPRAQEVAARAQKTTATDSELADLRTELKQVREELAAKEKQAEARSFVENWKSEAAKAIPTDKPTLIARLHSKSPEKAKQALVAIGAELERASGETPSHADVIAEFEKRERAELEDRGVDVEALLKPAPAAPAKPVPKTLDVGAPAGGTRPVTRPTSREEKISAVAAGLKKQRAEAP